MDGLETMEAAARAWAGLPEQEGGNPFRPGDKVRRRQYAGPKHVGTVITADDDHVTVYSKVRSETSSRWVEATYTVPPSELVLANGGDDAAG